LNEKSLVGVALERMLEFYERRKWLLSIRQCRSLEEVRIDWTTELMSRTEIAETKQY